MNAALLMHHDEDVEVDINRQKAVALKEWSTRYEIVPIDAEGRKLLTTGKNLLAVHCRQTGGGQFIDVHVINADRLKNADLDRCRHRRPIALLSITA